MTNFTIGESDTRSGTTSEDQAAAALACLKSHDAMDLAPMLGLA